MRNYLICMIFIMFFLNITYVYAGTVEQTKANISGGTAQTPASAVSSSQSTSTNASTAAPAPAVNTPLNAKASPTAAMPHQVNNAQAPNLEQRQEAMQAYTQGKYAKAHTLWIALAKAGDGEAMNNLGMLYDVGQGVPQNTKEALMWFRKSAEKGHAGGMSNLGRMLEQGRGTARHVDTAAAWFRKAADLGQADAQYNLGVLYERGEGVIKNDQHAAAWYSMAAASGQIDAQARLGQLYRAGKGVNKDYARATLLLYGAAMNGHNRAREELMAMATEQHKDKGLPQVNIFGAELSSQQGVKRGAMRAALALANVKPIREDMTYICDVYDLQNSVPGASQMAACYSAVAASAAEQLLGFLKIDYMVNDKKQADAIQKMVESRFGAPSAGENDTGSLWNLGPVIVATQYVPEVKQVGLMYMLPNIYHLTKKPAAK